jgi:hypothetical protein
MIAPGLLNIPIAFFSMMARSLCGLGASSTSRYRSVVMDRYQIVPRSFRPAIGTSRSAGQGDGESLDVRLTGYSLGYKPLFSPKERDSHLLQVPFRSSNSGGPCGPRVRTRRGIVPAAGCTVEVNDVTPLLMVPGRVLDRSNVTGSVIR